MDEQITNVPVEEPIAEQPAVAQEVTAPAVAEEVAAPAVAEAPVAPVVVEAAAPVKYCSGCGNVIPDGMKFCPNCGKAAAAAPAKKASSKKPLIIAIAAAVAAIAIGLGIFLAIPKEIPATDIVLSSNAVEIKETENTTLSCTVYPEDATDKTVVYTSSNEAVATVNELGTITAVGKGDCIITVQCGTVMKMVNVTVKTNIDFKALYENIDSDVKYGWTVGSDGSFLSADTNVYNLDDYSNGTIWASIKEMNKALGLPASLAEDMGSTTWSMGRQNQQFPSLGIEVTWTYHPDKGMEVTYKLLAN